MKTIPVVVHVLYNTPEQNISDAQIQSQIDILNADFSRTNADAVNTPPAFAAVAVDTGIRFCHVLTIRKETTNNSFSNNNAAKFCSSGGNDAIDPSKYMNIWVCNLGGSLLGYGEFPNTSLSNTHGVVVNYRSFGNVGTAAPPYNKGRTLTHEISHCLGVYHIFDESKTPCIKTDHCKDIPAQSSPSYGCHTFPTADNCSALPNGIMFMNYMDYSDDACMNMFTKDQADRMNAVLSIAPYNNLGSGNCVTPTVKANDACVSHPPVLTPINNNNFAKSAVPILLIVLIVFLLIQVFNN